MVWDTVSALLGLSFPCLQSCLPSGMQCPPLWSCLSLVPGLVSQVVHLVWDAVSASVFPLSLVAQLVPSGLGYCGRLAGLVFLFSRVLSPSLSPICLGCCVRLSGLVSVFLLSAVLSLSLSPIWSGMLCPPHWACLSLVSSFASIWSEMLCPPAWACLSLLFGLVSQILRPPPWYCFLVCQLYLLLSFVLSPQLSPISSGMLCSPPRACLFLVSGLVSRLSPIWSGVLCSPPWACLSPQAVCCWGSPCFLVCLPRLEYCVRLAGLVFLVFQLVWDAVSVLWACLRNLMCDLCNCLGSTVV